MYHTLKDSNSGGSWEMMSAEEALAFMEQAPELPSVDNFTSILQKCRQSRSLACAKRAHTFVCSNGLEAHKVLGNYLVPMFVECGSMHHAQQIFSRFPHWNEYSWTSLIQGFVDHGDSRCALDMFKRMEEECMHPTRYTFVALLKACAKLKCMDRGREIHADIAMEGLEGDPFLVSALVDMYSKCGSLAEAQDVFNWLPDQDVVCWTALITGYAEQGLGEKAWRCLEQMQLGGVSPDVVLWNAVILAYAEHGESEKAFKRYGQMQEQGLPPNLVTFLNVLKACGNRAALKVGVKVHAQIQRPGSNEMALVTALIDMYGKCGSMVDAERLFDAMPMKNLVTWNSLITGYAHQGENELVFGLFDRMREEGVQPDGITFINILSVCCHGGFLDKGQEFFQAMRKEYSVTPTIKHYNCMIDLLGRLGQLNEAVMMMEQMPYRPNYVTWSSLLGACQKWGDVELCKRAFEHAVGLKEKDATVFILMSNIYADVQKWGEMKKTEAMRENIPTLKGPERS